MAVSATVGFAEPFAQLTAPYARFTKRLNHVLERVGLALAGRAGAWLAAQLGLRAGRMTLLRRVMALPDLQSSTPRVLVWTTSQFAGARPTPPS
ncbi:MULTISPECIES: hypothetical protein [unclassified Streptomyces]|uniref:hypothetical protein n=1 Tax=unclassified Streptomyces TaxID=2593676 RepID=UPI002E138B64|nr:hypothetical protein OG395_52440 [Streptomyces sp. NBC_01320]